MDSAHGRFGRRETWSRCRHFSYQKSLRLCASDISDKPLAGCELESGSAVSKVCCLWIYSLYFCKRLPSFRRFCMGLFCSSRQRHLKLPTRVLLDLGLQNSISWTSSDESHGCGMLLKSFVLPCGMMLAEMFSVIQ